ncbi:PQQ-binding-like beta-propeller repeat protein [Chitinophaga qingshengii]|uniref:PQQ-binding-like beta-propeller repeat protein n=1 Tax=Chitinophaga qingshengii TaxID=1569794 RepID=A0ABR7TSR7_9BACT|nr:PQQ-binding-like beta-propeller repeat protein [Chitinophaga qingshengii]MBC9933497.1 PQQ-binding-like beta-propeller repeat protein [Chitinophaga qingshengii]
MHSSIVTRTVLLLLVTSMFSCSKTNETAPETSPVPDPTIPATPNRPSGALYVDYGSTLNKINVVDSSIIWESGNYTLFGSMGSAMVLDSTFFYYGSSTAVAGYSKKDGSNKWLFRWQMFMPAPLLYSEPVIQNNQVFFTASTDKNSTPAMLYCFDKITGVQKWSVKVDNSSLNSYFNTTPVVLNDRVILGTMDAANHKHLTAYRVSDGVQQWTSAINDNLSTRPKGVNNRIYSFEKTSVSCYSATDGTLQWQTSQGDWLTGTSTFFNNNEPVVVRLYDARYDVYTLNTADGKLLKKASIQAPTGTIREKEVGGCSYYNNKLIVVNKRSDDSLAIRCFDLSTQKLSWERHFEHVQGQYDIEMFAPLLTSDYIIFPTVSGHSSDYSHYKALMHFLNLAGEEVISIPMKPGIFPNKFAYEEKGIIYNQHNRIVLP